MQFLNLTEDDWPLFLYWAEVEGWRISFQERRLFQNQWRPYFFALHTDFAFHGFNLGLYQVKPKAFSLSDTA